MSENGVVDITILGAGPSGLAAAYYAGHRDASVRIIESLEQIGGQVAAVYPEKHVFDVAGHPKIQGQALIDLCSEQGLQYEPEVLLGEEVQTLEGLQAGFAINNPNVSAACGCGHSFQVEEGEAAASDAGCGSGCSH